MGDIPLAAEQEGHSPSTHRPRVGDIALGVVVAVYGLGTAMLMATLGLRTPFADQWRQDMPLLHLPFPVNVLQLESGHRQVLPNLVRIADLHWFRGNGELLAWTGVGLFVAFFALLVRGLRPASGDSRTRRLAALAAVAIGLGWLVNGRMLLHPNESVQVGGVLVGTLAALVCANSEVVGWTRLAAIVASCTAATFCFGTGFASFAAATSLLLLRRAGKGPVLAVAAAAAIVLFAYLVLLPRGVRIQADSNLGSVVSSTDLPRWLAAPWIQAFFGLSSDTFQSGIATVVAQHGPHGPLLTAAARAVATPLGPETTMQLAGTVLGLLGLVLLAAAAWRTFRRGDAPTPLQRLGLGLALFGCAAGGLVCAARTSYFAALPLQIFAERYLPWSGFFWSGLFMYWVLGSERGARRAAVILPLLAVAIWPVHRAWISWGVAFRNVAERGALILRHGIDDPDHGNLPVDLVPFTFAECAEAHRAQGVAMFGEPAIPTIGARLPPPVIAPNTDLPFIGMLRRIEPVGPGPRSNGSEHPAGPAWLQTAQFLPQALLDRNDREWPIVDQDGLVVGCARADEGHAWLRWLPQPVISRRGNFYVLQGERSQTAWLVEPLPPHRVIAVVGRTLVK